MQLAILLLLVVALGLLVLGLVASSSPLVIASIVASGCAAYLIVRSRRAAGERLAAVTGRHSAEPPERSTAAPAPAGPAEPASADPAPAVPVPAELASAEPAPAEPAPADLAPARAEPDAAVSEAPLRAHGGDLVWVIDGRPRYHVEQCGFISGLDGEPVPLQQAVDDGFTPCSLCDPDVALQQLPTG